MGQKSRRFISGGGSLQPGFYGIFASTIQAYIDSLKRKKKVDNKYGVVYLITEASSDISLLQYF